MGKLSAKQESFIELMKKSVEHARRGFELLLARPDFEEYFDPLEAAGFFDPKRNPSPVPAEDPGYVRVPYWEALDYLQAVAKLSENRNDLELARKVMRVVVNVSRASEPDGGNRDNYHTCRIFAEILGLVPTSVVSLGDLNIIPIWLGNRFERGMVCHALDDGLMRRLLSSDLREDWGKVVAVLRHVTAVRWVKDPSLGEGREKPQTLVEDHWLKMLIVHHARVLGTKMGRECADIFIERIREVFGRVDREMPSRHYRPAIEEHEQNFDWQESFNRFVEGLRDVLLGWVDADVTSAKVFIEGLVRDDEEILRRIGIYVVGQRWESLREIYRSIVGPSLFSSGHLHELYGLLAMRFESMNEAEKESTRDAIRRIPLPDGDEAERRLKRKQRRWLSAIAGKGDASVDTWYRDLEADKTIGRLSSHPDFDAYMESFSGPGPTPYKPQELIANAEAGSLIDKLNLFKTVDEWRGPSTDSLVDALVEAVVLSPNLFLHILPEFVRAKRPFQYGVIKGFKRLWESAKDDQSQIDWDNAWVSLVEYFAALIGDPTFWTESVAEQRDLIPTRDWIPPVIAEFLEAGTKQDAHAYPESLLPSTLPLIEILLDKSEAVGEASDDSMTQAINSSKGKAIESLINHALRVCRLSDKKFGSHVEAWADMAPIFERELERCKKGNYEFSTLAGAYIANFDYMSHEWLRANISRIFSADFPTNCQCALGGLAYAPANRPVYVLLLESGVLDRALGMDLKGRHTREKINERVALACLWGDEDLDSPRLRYLLEKDLVEDLEDISNFFWSVSNQDLSAGQRTTILGFWSRCVSWSRAATEAPAKLMSSLSRLTCYLDSIGDEERGLLLAVAPHVHVGHNSDDFVEELDRLVEGNAEAVSEVFGRMLETRIPTWDFQDRIKSLLVKLAQHGRKMDALAYAEKLLNLPGMAQTFSELRSA